MVKMTVDVDCTEVVELPSGGNEPGYRSPLIDELPVVIKGELPRSARKKRVPPLSLT